MKLKVKKKVLFTALSILLIIVIGGIIWYLGPANKPQKGTPMKAANTIIEDLQSDQDVQTFTQKLNSVGYETFLQGNGPFTVFVPTEAAYAKIADKKDFTDPALEPYLRQILQYHVVNGIYYTKDFTDGMDLESINGDKIHVTKYKGNWLLDSYAVITTSDIKTKNGVIHIINQYLIPPSITY